jgi:uncharacterized protein
MVESHGSYFGVYTYPFSILALDVRTEDEGRRVMLDLAQDGETFSPSVDYSYKGFYALEWIVTNDCVLNCPHCFARKQGDEGRYGLPAGSSLTLAEMMRSVDFAVEELRADVQKHNLEAAQFEVFIIGGEPLMRFDDLRQSLIHTRAQIQKMREDLHLERVDEKYFMATNGVLMNAEMADFLTVHNVTVSVSIDTPINPIKVDCDNRRSIESALRAVRLLAKRGHKDILLNCVIPAEHVYQMDEIMQYIEQLDVFPSISGVQLSPAVPPSRQTAFSGCASSETILSGWSGDIDRARFFASKLIEYSLKYKTDMKKYHSRVANMLLQGGVGYRCPVAQWKWCVVPGGDVYACHQLVGVDGFVMGNVNNDFATLRLSMAPLKETFAKRNVFDVTPCSSCVLQSCCVVFVDCPARCHLEGGDLFAVPPHQCETAKGYLLDIFEDFIWKSVASMTSAGDNH